MTIRKSMVSALVALVVSGSFLSGCAVVLNPLPAALYWNVSAPITYNSGSRDHPYEVLGEVEGRAMAMSVLGIISSGDASIHTAYKRALSDLPEADALINVTVDYEASSVIFIAAKYATIVRGTAVRYRTEPLSATQATQDRLAPTSKQQVPPQESRQDDFRRWKVSLIERLKWDHKLRSKWYWYKKRGKLDINRDEWAARLTESDYRAYLQSRLSISKWLDQVFSQ